jgi:hypothetical protein
MIVEQSNFEQFTPTRMITENVTSKIILTVKGNFLEVLFVEWRRECG